MKTQSVIRVLLAIQNYSASMAELEPRAAGILLAVFGIPALVFGAAFGFRLWFANKNDEEETKQKPATSAATD